jgi:hypothetical protein
MNSDICLIIFGCSCEPPDISRRSLGVPVAMNHKYMNSSRPPQCLQDCKVLCYYCPSQNACQYFPQPSGGSINSDIKPDKASSGVNERNFATGSLARHVSFGSGPWHSPAALVRNTWRHFMSHCACTYASWNGVLFWFFLNEMTAYNELIIWTSCLSAVRLYALFPEIILQGCNN